MTNKEKIKDLEQKLQEARAVIMFYTKSGETKKVQGDFCEYDVDAGAMYHSYEVPMCDGGVLAKRYIQKYDLWEDMDIYYHPILEMNGC
jgi:hypothetical protein